MFNKIHKTLILVILLAFFNFEPENSGGTTAPRVPYNPYNARLVNSFSDYDYYLSFDRTVDYFMRSWDIRGASIAVVKDGSLVLAKGYGHADEERSIDVEPYHRFRIASISKLITATAIMKLNEEGRLGLNDHIFGPGGILNTEYLADPRDPRAEDITVAHLLSHKGGWTTRWGDQMFMPLVVASSLKKEPPVETVDIVRFALNKRLHFTPGHGRSYSNLGYAILGLVIEEISGMAYEEYCQAELFEPLGIFDMELARNLSEERGVYEVNYYEPSNALLKKSIFGDEGMVAASDGGNDIEALGGAGAWVATAPDLARFVLAIDGFDDYPDILSEESIRFMTDINNGWAPVGWKGTAPGGYWWRTGSFAGTSAMTRRYPDGTVWVALFNTNTWKQSKFPSDVSSMMMRAMARTDTWSDINLFDYILPVPLDPLQPY